MDKYERQNRDNIARVAKEIERIYVEAAKEAARIGVTVDSLTEDIFTFDNFPNTHKRIERLMREFHDSLYAAIVNGISNGHTLANNKNNELSRLVFGDAIRSMPESELSRYIKGSAAASDAFASRRADGLKLSDRVWRYTDMYRSEIEMGLDIGIREGRSAAEMARDLQKYLRYPDKLFRRVRDQHGNLVLSQRARNFHPGRGVNRSSFQNARRLAATETNIAYRTADHERMQDMDFVVGIEVHLSNNHNCKGVPEGQFRDICDELVGKYPKTFKFNGFHPFCRCYTTTILNTAEERAENRRRRAQGLPPLESKNTVKDVPEGFKRWVEDNASRIERAAGRGTLPYFLRDNGEVKDGQYEMREGLLLL